MPHVRTNDRRLLQRIGARIGSNVFIITEPSGAQYVAENWQIGQFLVKSYPGATMRSIKFYNREWFEGNFN